MSDSSLDADTLYCLCRQPDDRKQFMIECEACKEWFHGLCVNLTETEGAKIDQYECDACRKQPDSKGIIWKTAEQIAKEAQVAAKKKSRPRARKRKDEEFDDVAEIQRRKQRRLKKEAESTQATIPDVLRKTVRKNMEAQLTIDGDEGLAEKRATEIEQALFEAFPDGTAYTPQFRMLVSNMKRSDNSHLRPQLLSGELPVAEFVALSPEELASADLAEYRRQREAELDQKIIREAETGPVYRNTHKGLELVVPAQEKEKRGDETFNPGRMPRKPVPKDGEASTPREMRGATGPEGATGAFGEGDEIPGAQTMDLPDFDDFDTFQASAEGLPASNDRPGDILPDSQVTDDASLPATDATDDSNGVEPAMEPAPSVWSGECGTLLDNSRFPAHASFVCGRASGYRFDLAATLPSVLRVEGRMPLNTMEKYIGEILESDRRELTVLALDADSKGEESYTKLLEHLLSIQRAMVVSTKGSLKDGRNSELVDVYCVAITVSKPPQYITPPIRVARKQALMLVIVSKALQRGKPSSRDHSGARQSSSHMRSSRDRNPPILGSGEISRPQATVPEQDTTFVPAPKPFNPVAEIPSHLSSIIQNLVKQQQAQDGEPDQGSHQSSWATPAAQPAPRHTQPPSNGGQYPPYNSYEESPRGSGGQYSNPYQPDPRYGAPPQQQQRGYVHPDRMDHVGGGGHYPQQRGGHHGSRDGRGDPRRGPRNDPRDDYRRPPYQGQRGENRGRWGR